MAFHAVISYHECEESREADRRGPASPRGSPSLWRPRSHPPSKYVKDTKGKEARDFFPSLNFSHHSVWSYYSKYNTKSYSAWSASCPIWPYFSEYFALATLFQKKSTEICLLLLLLTTIIPLANLAESFIKRSLRSDFIYIGLKNTLTLKTHFLKIDMQRSELLSCRMKIKNAKLRNRYPVIGSLLSANFFDHRIFLFDCRVLVVRCWLLDFAVIVVCCCCCWLFTVVGRF
jgi:hypothetical protein